jgi:acyl dehydratase
MSPTLDPMTDIQALVEQMKERIGLEGPTVTRKMEAGALIKFSRATGETDPLLIDEAAACAGPFGAIVAPPTYVSTFAQFTMAGLLVQDLPLEIFLHTDDAVELGVPIVAGDDITAVARYADAYVREGRNGPLLFQKVEMTLVNQRGEQAAVVRIGSVNFKSGEQEQ